MAGSVKIKIATVEYTPTLKKNRAGDLENKNLKEAEDVKKS